MAYDNFQNFGFIANPINAGTGNKFLQQTDFASSGLLRFSRYYNSTLKTWMHSYQMRISTIDRVAYVLRPDGKMFRFFGDGSGNWMPASGTVPGQLFHWSDASNGSPGWKYIRIDGVIEWFDRYGLPVLITSPDGQQIVLSYADGLLQRVTDSFGHAIKFGYDTHKRLESMGTPTNAITRYGYDGQGRFVTVINADGTNRQYVYEDTNNAYLLTGIVDEAGFRYATYGYDQAGRANLTKHALNALRHVLQYNSDGTVLVTDSLGTQRTYLYSSNRVINNSPPQLVQTDKSCANCASSIATRQLDPNTGLIDNATDFLGAQTTFVWDAARRLPLSKQSAANTPVAQIASTEWHPTQALPTKVARAGTISTHVYNGQPDPFNDGLVANCASPNAILPDGLPIAVLCKSVQQVTTDENGAQGLSGALQPGVPARIWTWSYNQDGQVLLATDPLGHNVSYSYYTDTTATHTRGDLQSSTNALGHTTQYTQYDASGNLLQSIDPNGVVSASTYDLRNRLSSQSVAGQTTSLTYTATGQPARITQPDGSFVSYGYDAAQRLTAISDNLGNSVAFTLDNAGNRTSEQVKDPAGALRRQLNRMIDALGNTQQITGLN